MELISIVIPVYNGEAYLEACLDSILQQTHNHYEVIAVDDGSTDDSRTICEEYVAKDDRLRLVCQTNAGASAARNRGLKEAVGEYVYFLDSDDWIESTAFEEFICAEKKNNADVIFFDAYSIDEETDKITEKHYRHNFKYEVDCGPELLRKLIDNK